MTLAIFTVQFKTLSAALAALISSAMAFHASASRARITFIVYLLLSAFLVCLTIAFLQHLPRR